MVIPMLQLIRKFIDKNPYIRTLLVLIGVLAVVLVLVNVRSKDRYSGDKKSDGEADQTVSTALVTSDSTASGAVSLPAGNDGQQTASFAEMAAGMSKTPSFRAENAVSAAEEINQGPPKGEVTITVSAAGDCTLGSDDGMDYDLSFYAKYDEVGYPGWFLENVHDVFATDDLTIVNFEGTLSNRGVRAEKTYAFRGPPEYADILTEGSVEAVDLANNHSFDYGKEAYEDTKQILEDAGIVSFGYDRSQVIEIKGIKIGLVGIFELEEGFDCVDLMREQIRDVKERGAQLVIVSFHWGDEGYYEVNETQIELGREAVLAGANLVLGHHPHRVQGVDCYQGVYICYSLGNFCFGGNSDPSDKDSMIFRQTFTFEDGVLQDTDEHLIIPCSISSTYYGNNFQPTILEDEEGDRVLEKIRDLF